MRRAASRLLQAYRLPRTHPRDVFIASYPRSGSTWVRFLLANLVARGSEQIDFQTLPRYVPDLHIEEQWRTIRNMHSPRLLKTHELPSRRFRRVIYLLRDGRDVAVSHYLYLCGLDRFDGSFLDFVRNTDIGPARWAKHVSSWLETPGRPAVFTVRYEDLLADTADELRRMAEFAELPTDEKNVERAVTRSNFAVMKKLQDTAGRPYDDTEGMEHVRKGTAGQWKGWFDRPHTEAFEKIAGDVLRRLGYEDHAGS
ncbi:MAG: sulfotransferase domain-containing protein [Phycisphaerae bacterium]